MVTLEGLQSQLLAGLDLLVSHLLDLAGEDDLGLGGTVDTVGLDTDDDTTLGLEEHVGVQADDTGLIGLGNVREDDVDHGHEHAVAERVSGVVDDGDDVGAVGSHADQVTARAVRELDGVDVTGGTDQVRDVADRGTAGGTQVQHLGARAHVDVVQTTQDTGRQLGAEGVPHTVLGLGHGALVTGGTLDRDTLLAVDGLTGGQVLGDQQIFLAGVGDEDTSVTVGFLWSRTCQFFCIHHISPLLVLFSFSSGKISWDYLQQPPWHHHGHRAYHHHGRHGEHRGHHEGHHGHHGEHHGHHHGHGEHLQSHLQ